MNGLSADMDALEEIGRKHATRHGPIPVIGDAARTLGATCKGTRVGRKGWMNIFSFHTEKMITTLGGGGAITTDGRDLDTAPGDASVRNYLYTLLAASIWEAMNRVRAEGGK